MGAIRTRTEDVGRSLCVTDKQPAHREGQELNKAGHEEDAARVYVCRGMLVWKEAARCLHLRTKSDLSRCFCHYTPYCAQDASCLSLNKHRDK